MSAIPMPFPELRRYTRDGVQIVKVYVDWSQHDPGGCARRNIKWIVDSDHHQGHAYVNPGFILTAPATVPEKVFLVEARRACILWNKRLARVFGSSQRRKMIKALPLDEQIFFSTGALFLNGAPADPKWMR